MTQTTKQGVGVVVGRFQTTTPHEGHRHLLSYASERHEHLLVVVGKARTYPTPKDPLSFEMRAAMVRDAMPHATVVPLSDHRSDEIWSAALDELIEGAFPGLPATLYGSRDSFFPYYTGKNRTEHVEEIPNVSATELRARCARDVCTSNDFRAGVIHAHATRAPITYPAVDIAIMKPETQEVLLGRKAGEDGWRFPGGFVDTEDPSYEFAAKREAYQETSGIEIDDLIYVGSTRVDDWRYRGSKDGIMTVLYRATYIFGAPRAADDIAELRFVELSEMLSALVPEHHMLGELLLAKLPR